MVESGSNGASETTPMAHTETDGQDASMPPNESTVMTPTEQPPLPLEKIPEADVEAGKTRSGPEFCGLSKEELMQYANDPFWVRLRWIFFIGFWIIWLSMLVGAILIIVFGPKCDAKLKWWQKDSIYEVYARSFKDSNGDGIGDIQGIISKLDYLKNISVKSVWLSPVYKSPMKDFGYDVSDYQDIDPVFGTLADFDQLLSEMKSRDMHLILDFVPNHSSDQHEWFVKSAARQEPYTDFYVWADNGTAGGPPNDWLSAFGGSAWTYHPQRGQYYYHQFLPQQPDLNYRSTAVLTHMLDQMRFWLARGVTGFRLDAVRHLLETQDLTAVEAALPGSAGATWHERQHAGVTADLPDSLDIVAKFRELCDQTAGDVVLLAEVAGATDEHQLQYYGTQSRPLVHLPLYTGLIDGLATPQQFTAASIDKAVAARTGDQLPASAWPAWQTGNHDVSRAATRLGTAAAVPLLHVLALTLPGTPVLYYGDELAMPDVRLSFDQTVDPRGRACGARRYQECSRDPSRTPMQWSDAVTAGFCEPGVTPWLPVGDSRSAGVSVLDQQSNATVSPLSVFTRLHQLRQQHQQLTDGEFATLVVNDQIYSYVRQLPDSEAGSIVVVLNTGDTAVTAVDLTSSAVKLPAAGGVQLLSTAEDQEDGAPLQLNKISLAAKQALVIEVKPPTAE